jgi:hypothetical protein
MTTDLKKWHYIEDEDRWMSPKGRLVFVALAKKFRSKDAKPEDEGQFAASMIFAPHLNHTPIEKVLLDLAVAEKYKNKKGKVLVESDLRDFDKWKDLKLNWPFIDADANLADITSKGEPVDLEGWKLIRPNAYSKRPVVRNSAGEVLDLDDIQTEAYSGRWGRLMLQPKAYNRPDNKGVKFYVDAVQLLGNDDSISKGGGSKGEAFSAVDDEDEEDGALD